MQHKIAVNDKGRLRQVHLGKQYDSINQGFNCLYQSSLKICFNCLGETISVDGLL